LIYFTVTEFITGEIQTSPTAISKIANKYKKIFSCVTDYGIKNNKLKPNAVNRNPKINLEA